MRDRVSVSKSPKRNFSVTVRADDARVAQARASPCRRGGRARGHTRRAFGDRPRTSPRRRSTSSPVRARPARSSLCASACRCWPARVPSAAASAVSGSAATSPMVCTPIRSSLRPRRRADTPEARDGQRREEGALGPGLDDEQAVGFGHVARDLGEELRRGDTDRRGQTRSRRARGLGATSRSPTPVPSRRRAPRNVEERLVDRQRLDERRDRPEDRHHLAALLLVALEARREEHGVRAGPPGPRHRHRRVHAEGARLVARGGHDAAVAEPADDHRLAARAPGRRAARPSVERVEVDVQDRRVGARVTAIAADRRRSVVARRAAAPRSGSRRRSPGSQRSRSHSLSGSRTHGAHDARRRRHSCGGTNAASTTMPSGSSTRRSPSNFTARCTSHRMRQPMSGACGVHLVERARPLVTRRGRSPPRPRG